MWSPHQSTRICCTLGGTSHLTSVFAASQPVQPMSFPPVPPSACVFLSPAYLPPLLRLMRQRMSSMSTSSTMALMSPISQPRVAKLPGISVGTEGGKTGRCHQSRQVKPVTSRGFYPRRAFIFKCRQTRLQLPVQPETFLRARITKLAYTWSHGPYHLLPVSVVVEKDLEVVLGSRLEARQRIEALRRVHYLRILPVTPDCGKQTRTLMLVETLGSASPSPLPGSYSSF